MNYDILKLHSFIHFRRWDYTNFEIWLEPYAEMIFDVTGWPSNGRSIDIIYTTSARMYDSAMTSERKRFNSAKRKKEFDKNRVDFVFDWRAVFACYDLSTGAKSFCLYFVFLLSFFLWIMTSPRRPSAKEEWEYASKDEVIPHRTNDIISSPVCRLIYRSTPLSYLMLMI